MSIANIPLQTSALISKIKSHENPKNYIKTSNIKNFNWMIYNTHSQ